MFMKSRIIKIGMQIFALFFVVSITHAQTSYPDHAAFSQPELEQMLAPVALYPDSLLSQILMASTYPNEVVDAAFWLRDNPGLRGEGAIRAAEGMQWDISVKSLLPFPHLLDTMESRFDWTQNLGNAFLGQQAQVMDTVQILRHRAMVAGYLRSDSHITVMQDGRLISIVPAESTAVYVPYYNPSVVYGRWPQPAYAPVAWQPWPGYPPRQPRAGWAWSPVATVVAVGVLFAVFDWNHHQVHHRPQVNYWHRHPDYAHHAHYGPQNHWQHDPRHRREIPYRHRAVEVHHGEPARAHNAKVGPRPTVHDIRSGRRQVEPIHRPNERMNDQNRHDNGHSNLSPIVHDAPKTDHHGPSNINRASSPRENDNRQHDSSPRGREHETRQHDSSPRVRDHDKRDRD
jgi:hypothetical protein